MFWKAFWPIAAVVTVLVFGAPFAHATKPTQSQINQFGATVKSAHQFSGDCLYKEALIQHYVRLPNGDWNYQGSLPLNRCNKAIAIDYIGGRSELAFMGDRFFISFVGDPQRNDPTNNVIATGRLNHLFLLPEMVEQWPTLHRMVGDGSVPVNITGEGTMYIQPLKNGIFVICEAELMTASEKWTFWIALQRNEKIERIK